VIERDCENAWPSGDPIRSLAFERDAMPADRRRDPQYGVATPAGGSAGQSNVNEARRPNSRFDGSKPPTPCVAKLVSGRSDRSGSR